MTHGPSPFEARAELVIGPAEGRTRWRQHLRVTDHFFYAPWTTMVATLATAAPPLKKVMARPASVKPVIW